MSKSPGFRGWYYFRQGWSVYFAFIMAAINTLTVTYFLAIENYPALQEIFPSFIHYIIIVGVIGVPLLITIGYVHYKRTMAFSAEADVIAETHPYNYKLPPRGWNQQVNYPLYSLLTKFMLKSNSNEKLTEKEIKEIQDLQTKINTLLDGNFIHDPRSRNNTSD
jgi:hypothetical protein